MPTAYINAAGAIKILEWIVSGLGIYRILRKCSLNGLWAFIPGFRLYKLSEAAGCEGDGLKALVLEIPTLIASYFVLPLIGDETRNSMIIAVVILAATLAILIFEIRIYLDLCITFSATRLWTFLWVLFALLPALVWGFSGKYQPIDSARDDDNLAGTKPAELDTYTADTGKGEADALCIHVRKRVVYDFLRKRYLLKDVSLRIPRGDMVMLLGGSGAGKTTLVNAVTGYEKADAEILLNGDNVYRHYDRMKYRIGLVPQQDLMRECDTVRHTITDAARMRLPEYTRRADVKKRINDVLETLGLTAGQGGLISKKSGGQKKRISIGMELVADPELFILDEPDSGLDAAIARELFTKLREIADEGKIVIAITHTPDRVIDLFTKVIILAKDSGRVGRLAFYGTPDEAREFFGRDTMEGIIVTINRREEGGEGRADEFISKYAGWARARGGAH